MTAEIPSPSTHHGAPVPTNANDPVFSLNPER